MICKRKPYLSVVAMVLLVVEVEALDEVLVVVRFVMAGDVRSVVVAVVGVVGVVVLLVLLVVEVVEGVAVIVVEATKKQLF